MTDKEIIKALEDCSTYAYHYCSECGFKDGDLLKAALDIINRQQAEIVRLKSMNQAKLDAIHDLQAQNELLSRNADTAFQDGLNERRDLFEPEIKAEVIKKFVERLKDRIVNGPSVYPIESATLAFLNGSSHRQLEILEIIDNLVKEMVGETE